MNQEPMSVKTSALAVWSLILGILGLVCFGIFSSIPAIVCGHMGRSNIKKSNGALTGSGLALAGLILGYVGSVITTLIMIAVAIPAFFGYQAKANCALMELEAKSAMIAVDCYMADPSHQTLPTLEQLASDTQCSYQPQEGSTIEINGTMEQYQISLVDMADECAFGDRYIISMPENISDGWQ